MEGKGEIKRENKEEREREDIKYLFLTVMILHDVYYLYTYTHTHNGILKLADKIIEVELYEVIWSDIKLYKRNKNKYIIVK